MVRRLMFFPVWDIFPAFKVDVSRGEIVECLVVAEVDVVVHEAFDGMLEMALQAVASAEAMVVQRLQATI